MAQSARIQSLLARRTGSLYSGDRIRLLNPTSTSISSIAKKTVSNELDVMTKNYNAGNVSNTDFKAFLVKMLGTPGVSELDKTDIGNQINDFDSRILGDKLVQNYKASPDNTLQQVQAAQALSSYFRQRASTAQPDTPAYNDNMQNAIGYEQKVSTINDNIQKINRQNIRYLNEQQINKIPSSTSANSQAKADSWKQLYDQAIADGDTTAANQYAANYQKELTQAQTYQDAELTKGNKKTLSDFINTTINDYHDGKISGDDALTQLQQADQFAYDTGDTAAQNRLNSLSITINREIDKGITYSNVGGLSTKSKGGGSGGDLYLNPDGSVSYGGNFTASKPGIGTKITAGGVGTKATTNKTKNTFTNGVDKPTTLAGIDLTYKNNRMQLSKDLLSGAITPDQYKAQILLNERSYMHDVGNITTGLQTILAQNPKAKLGGKQIQTILDDYTNKLTATTADYNGILSGTSVLKMGTQQITNPDGTISTTPRLDFIEKNKLGANDINANGIYYPARDDVITFGDRKSAENYAVNNGATAADVEFSKTSGKYAIKDAANAGSYLSKTYLDITDTAGNTVSYEENPTYGWLPVETGPKTGALRNQIIAEADNAKKLGQDYKPNLLNFGQLNNQETSYKDGKWQFNNKVGVGSAVGEAQQPQSQVSSNPINQVVQAIQEPITHPGFAKPDQGIGNSLTPLKQTTLSPTTPIVPMTGTAVQSKPAQQVNQLSIAGEKPVTTIPLPAGQNQVSIQAPPKIAGLPTNPTPQDYSIGSSLNALKQNLFVNPLNNVKKFFGIK